LAARQKGVSFSGSAKFVDDAVSIVYCNVQYASMLRIANAPVADDPLPAAGKLAY
jgi:hypothetical protein